MSRPCLKRHKKRIIFGRQGRAGQVNRGKITIHLIYARKSHT